jgi:hypothetical protein
MGLLDFLIKAALVAGTAFVIHEAVCYLMDKPTLTSKLREMRNNGKIPSNCNMASITERSDKVVKLSAMNKEVEISTPQGNNLRVGDTITF